ncbi:MAG: PIN domain-containing protein, partial [Leptolyngbya sp. DLM2.Bin27]
GQPRIRLEAEAVLEILERCQKKDWQLINSFALIKEIQRTSDPNRRQQVTAALDMANRTIEQTPEVIARAHEFIQLGIKNFDALHLACAEQGQVDAFLTTDDRLLRRAKSLSISITVENPLIWLVGTERANGENQ